MTSVRLRRDRTAAVVTAALIALPGALATTSVPALATEPATTPLTSSAARAPAQTGHSFARRPTPGPPPMPTTGITAPVGAGHRGGPALDRTGVLLVRRPAGVPRPPAFPAGAFLVADLNSGDVLLAFNAHVQARPASTMKTLTALALAPTLSPRQTLQAAPEDAAVDGTKVGLDPGAYYSVDQLLHALLMSSANDAAVALARANGGLAPTLAEMNKVAANLGAVDTRAKNTSGLDATGQVTTAYDLALLGRAAVTDPHVSKYLTIKTAPFPAGRPQRGQKRGHIEISSHNRLLWNYAGTIGVKNGYTVKARQTYIGAVRRGNQAYVVTYLAGEVTSWEQTAALLDWAFVYGPKLRPVGTLNQEKPLAAAGSVGDAASGVARAHRAADSAVDRLRSDRRVAVAAAAAGVALLAGAVALIRLRRRRPAP